ncbi:YkgJ family cysteine cluster protein [Leptothrix ochracea]|uniref:YkgJ family cysteine cluster protein n=2 Tax=Leptothrix ochracea TaxID=735331 RepID=UPI0034E24B13
MRSSIHIVDVDRLETWTRYRQGLCDSCAANCCTMPVEIRLTDLVRLGLVDPFEAEHEEPRLIARRLVKSRQVERYNHKDGLFTMARRANGDCQFLDAQTRRCTVYEQRPNTCRKHPQVGPKPGYCPYGARVKSLTPSA